MLFCNSIKLYKNNILRKLCFKVKTYRNNQSNNCKYKTTTTFLTFKLLIIYNRTVSNGLRNQ